MLAARRLAYGALLLSLCLSVPVASAQSGTMSMSEFQRLMFAYTLTTEATELETQLEELNLKEWQALYDAFGSHKETFAMAVGYMEDQAAASVAARHRRRRGRFATSAR